MEYTILILLLPLLSFLTLGIGGKWMTHRTAGIIGTTVLAVVALLSYATAWQYFSAPRLADGTFATLMPYNVTWLPFTPTLSIDLGILLDPISVMMLIVISTVSLMVHVYSFGYMKGERGFQRYYAFLSLFTMSMLGLVVATNIFQMYLFWELVGVSSYLLIGFYYTKPSAVAASKKAFIVTRFADLGFLIGILVYGYYAGTYTFQPDEMAKNIQQQGGVIPHVRPGKPTADFLARTNNRLTLFAALFLAVLATVPTLLSVWNNVQIPFAASSILIAVSVAIETVRQVEAQLVMRHYKGFL